MKQLLHLVTILIFVTCSSNSNTSIEILHQDGIIDLGKINKGQNPITKFRIKNIGSETLRIINSSSDCKCTAPKLSTKSVAPGSILEVSVRFMSSNYGKFQQLVYITANTDNPIILILRGEVI